MANSRRLPPHASNGPAAASTRRVQLPVDAFDPARRRPRRQPASWCLCSLSAGRSAGGAVRYRGPNPGYDCYLADLQRVCRSVGSLLTPAGWLVIEASNLRRSDRVDTLAWDIAHAVGELLPFAGEIAVRWEPTYGYGYDHSYCLLFCRRPARPCNGIAPGIP